MLRNNRKCKKSKMSGKKKRGKRKANSGLSLAAVQEEGEETGEGNGSGRSSARARKTSSARMLAAMDRYHSVMGSQGEAPASSRLESADGRRETFVNGSRR